MKVNQLPSLASNKMLVIGASGAGKTGSIIELAKSGYSLKIADFDDKVADLAVKSGILTPEEQENIDVIPFREAGEKQHKSYKEFKKALDDWEGTGGLTDWDTNTILLVDSLSFMGRAIFHEEERLNPGVKDPRQLYNAAQTELQNMLGRLTSSSVLAHVILTAHIQYQDIYAEQDDIPSQTKGFPRGIGKAISPYLGSYFNSMIVVESKKSKRVIKTKPDRFIDTKIPALESKGLKEEYPVEGGMREIFKILTPDNAGKSSG